MNKYSMLLIDLLVLIYLLYRQRQIRQVDKTINIKFPVILIILGIYSLSKHFSSKAIASANLIPIIGILLFLAVGMGGIRASTVKLWQENDTVFRQGTWLTVGLWIISVMLHLAVDRIGQTGEVTLLIYYGITLTVQRFVVQYRVRRNFPNI